jgi:hypothetical protein
MGAKVSVVDRTEYNLADHVKVKVQGGMRALGREMGDGDKVTVRLDGSVESSPTKAALAKLFSYFRSSTFKDDAESTILFRDQDAPGEYNLDIPEATLEGVSWRVPRAATSCSSKAAGGGTSARVTVEFQVVVHYGGASNKKGHHKFAHICAYLAACMGRHISAGTVPVGSLAKPYDDCYYQADTITFSRNK